MPQRRRRRRFPERELLERLRKYEGLLRQNSITFEPLHKDLARDKESLRTESGYNSPEEHSETVGSDLSTLAPDPKNEKGHEAKYAFTQDAVPI